MCFCYFITKVMGPFLFSPLFAQCFIEPWKIGVNQKIATSAFSLSIFVARHFLPAPARSQESHYKRVDCNILLHPLSLSLSLSVFLSLALGHLVYFDCARGRQLNMEQLSYQPVIKIAYQSSGWWICLSGVYSIKHYGKLDQSWGKNVNIQFSLAACRLSSFT